MPGNHNRKTSKTQEAPVDVTRTLRLAQQLGNGGFNFCKHSRVRSEKQAQNGRRVCKRNLGQPTNYPLQQEVQTRKCPACSFTVVKQCRSSVAAGAPLIGCFHCMHNTERRVGRDTARARKKKENKNENADEDQLLVPWERFSALALNKKVNIDETSGSVYPESSESASVMTSWQRELTCGGRQQKPPVVLNSWSLRTNVFFSFS